MHDFWIFFTTLGDKTENKAPEKQKVEKTVFKDNHSKNIWEIFETFTI